MQSSGATASSILNRGFHLARRRQRLCLLIAFSLTFYYFFFDWITGRRDTSIYDFLLKNGYLNVSRLPFPVHDPHYILFNPPDIDQATSLERYRGSRRPRQTLPEECLDAHFENGSPCYYDQDPSIDVVWTWTNGSDRQLADYMAKIAKTTRVMLPIVSRPNSRLFREHGELVHSVRSVVKHFRNSTTQLHIITPDIPFSLWSKPNEEHVEIHKRLGLLPYWLDMDNALTWKDGDVSLTVSFDSDIFTDYKNAHFNSLAVESQFGNLNASENFIYMNDDFFMMKDMAKSDFYTSAYGVVLRMQPNLFVDNQKEPPVRATGEWPPLEYTNWVLSQRFGLRKRPYMVHISKAMSLSLLKEFSTIWHKEIAATAAHPFRGMVTPHRDFYMLFAFIHAVVERWREALLWSWVVAKHGGLNGEWGTAEKIRAWRDLGGIFGDNILTLYMTPRSTGRKEVIKQVLEEAGHKVSRTKYSFVSGDGYPYAFFNEDQGKNGTWPNFDGPRKRLCTLSYEKCFDKPDITSASDFFKYITFEKNMECGDCIIHALRTASGKTGLSAFLPDSSRKRSGSPDPPQGMGTHGNTTLDDAPHLPLVSEWRDGDFSLQGVLPLAAETNIRKWTLRLLERYRFVVGETPAKFHMISSAGSASRFLGRLRNDTEVALLCLNDNIIGWPSRVDTIMRFWQERQWGKKADWERS